MERTIEIIRFPSLVAFSDAYDAQVARRMAVEEGLAGNALFLLEHRPVYTLGRNARPEHLLRTREDLVRGGVSVIETSRGGDVTYHGPGQLVAYPVLDLSQWRRSIRWYLRSLEEVIIRQLAGYGLEACRAEGFTGVWVDGAKVAAIGVGLHNWVTFHGIALNVMPDMARFKDIVPCGLAGKPVVSLQGLLIDSPDMDGAMDDFQKCFLDVFEAVPAER